MVLSDTENTPATINNFKHRDLVATLLLDTKESTKLNINFSPFIPH